MWMFENWPKPFAQTTLLLLLAAILLASVFTIYLWGWRPSAGRFFSAHRWAGTVSGLSVCAAFYQYATTRWIAQVMEEFGDIEKYPFGPPSPITRAIIDNPDAPIQSAIRNFLFFDPGLAALLGLWAGVFAILSYWID